MFTVTQDEATAIREALEQGGEWRAVVELRRHFPIDDNAAALRAVRMIARWPSTPPVPSAPKMPPCRKPSSTA